MSTYRWMRASDEDREEAAALLGDAFVAGRLTQDELDERCAAAYAAKTWGELDDLTADLPGILSVVRVQALPPSGVIIPRGGPRPDSPRPFWPMLALAVVLGAVLAWAASSAAAAVIPLALLLPLARGGISRGRRRR